mmetsp:Transcript_6759/g.27502  ORF Transcript_6759/g.27502 Transcript_6759/m.27502 type:complete len:586 (+) Transcript_6759:17-1774(+)
MICHSYHPVSPSNAANIASLSFARTLVVSARTAATSAPALDPPAPASAVARDASSAARAFAGDASSHLRTYASSVSSFVFVWKSPSRSAVLVGGFFPVDGNGCGSADARAVSTSSTARSIMRRSAVDAGGRASGSAARVAATAAGSGKTRAPRTSRAHARAHFAIIAPSRSAAAAAVASLARAASRAKSGGGAGSSIARKPCRHKRLAATCAASRASRRARASFLASASAERAAARRAARSASASASAASTSRSTASAPNTMSCTVCGSSSSRSARAAAWRTARSAAGVGAYRIRFACNASGSASLNRRQPTSTRCASCAEADAANEPGSIFSAATASSAAARSAPTSPARVSLPANAPAAATKTPSVSGRTCPAFCSKTLCKATTAFSATRHHLRTGASRMRPSCSRSEAIWYARKAVAAASATSTSDPPAVHIRSAASSAAAATRSNARRRVGIPRCAKMVSARRALVDARSAAADASTVLSPLVFFRPDSVSRTFSLAFSPAASTSSRICFRNFSAAGLNTSRSWCSSRAHTWCGKNFSRYAPSSLPLASSAKRHSVSASAHASKSAMCRFAARASSASAPL